MSKQKHKIIFFLLISLLILPFYTATAAVFLSVSDTMSTSLVSQTSQHTFAATLPSTLNFDSTGGTDIFLIDFPAGFTGASTWAIGDFSFNDGTLRTISAVAQGAGTATVTCTDSANTVGIAVDTSAHIFRVIPCGASFVASGNGATLTFFIDGTSPNGTMTGPSLSGNYAIGVSMKDENIIGVLGGTTTVTVVESGQTTVSARIDPVISFNAGAQAASVDCSASYGDSGGTVDLGTISRTSVASSDTDSIQHICTRLSTNASSGATVTVTSLNAALKSASTPADVIASVTASPLTGGAAGYGLCIGSGATHTGAATTVPASAEPVRSAPFDSTCTNSIHNIGMLSGSTQTLWTVSAPTGDAFARVFVKVGASNDTHGHEDYTDSLTFIAAGTF